MTKHILAVFLVGMLSAPLVGCISGVKSPDTYTGKDGKTTLIQSDREMCERDCNDTYSRCMETTSASSNGGQVNMPAGMFGAGGECRTDLQKCLPPCKAQ
jgi:hypothetical protein